MFSAPQTSSKVRGATAVTAKIQCWASRRRRITRREPLRFIAHSTPSSSTARRRRCIGDRSALVASKYCDGRITSGGGRLNSAAVVGEACCKRVTNLSITHKLRHSKSQLDIGEAG